MAKKSRNTRSCTKEEDKVKKLQRKYEEAKHEIKRLRNIIKRTNPTKLKEFLESSDESYKYNRPDKPERDSCPKCHGFKVSIMNFSRSDGDFKIVFCKADHCKHRSPMIKVENTDIINTQE